MLLSDFMEIKKEYLILVAVAIVLIFVLGIFYIFTSNIKITSNPYANQNNVNSNQNPQEPTNPQGSTNQQAPTNQEGKALSFVSLTCTVLENSNTIKFKIQLNGISLKEGEITPLLDGSLTDFKDSNGNKLSSTSLSAGTTSAEFSYTTQEHLPIRNLTISTPTQSYYQELTCP